MSRETYLRVRYTREGVENIAGLEYRYGQDDFGRMRTILKVRMKAACVGLMPGRYGDNAVAIADTMDRHWPDRKYFTEVGDDNDAWIQVFDPKRVFCKCGCTCGAS